MKSDKAKKKKKNKKLNKNYLDLSKKIQGRLLAG